MKFAGHALAMAAMLTMASSTLPAKADYTTACLLSFDWVIDSSDEIHLLRVESSGDDGAPVARLVRTLKQLPGTEPRSEKEFQRFPLPRDAEPGDEWLLFLRLKQGAPPKPAQWVNLARPLAHFRYAAVNRKGEPIPDRDSVMRALDARLDLDRRPPATSDREAIDGLASATYHLYGLWTDPLSTPSGMQRLIGGITIHSDCQYWDGPPYDLDTGITGIVIPADPEEYPRLLAAAKQCINRLPNTPARINEYEIPVLALSNYPCKATEDVLQAIARGTSHYTLKYRSMAQKVLSYFRYYPAKTDPLHHELTGRWRLTGHQERIDVTLRADNSFVADGFDLARKQADRPGLPWHGEGRWAVRDRKLSICRTRLRFPQAKAFETSFVYRRRIFEDKKILAISPTRVDLENGPLMERIAQPPAE